MIGQIIGLVVLVGCGKVERAEVDGGGGDGPDGGPTDTTAPTVTATEPGADAADLEVDLTISVTFSEEMDPDSLTGDSFQVLADGEPIDGAVGYDGLTATFTPAEALASGTIYTATVSTAAADVAGNSLAEGSSWTFTTRTSTCVKVGGGGGCLPTISAAVAASAAGESIAVAAGSYVENPVIDRTVVLLGGYSEDFTRRNPDELVTTISPDDDSLPVVRVNGGVGDSAAVAPIIDGFTVTGGRVMNDHGGAFHVSNSDVQLRHNVIVDNQAFFLGGGVYITGGAALVIGNRIEGNTVSGQDQDCSGGGIVLEGTSATLIDNIIIDNEAPVDLSAGGGIEITGGGPVLLVNNVVSGNRIGGINLSGNGGGIEIAGAEVHIVGGEISDNEITASGSGGGLFVIGSVVTVEGVRILDNGAGANAGTGSGVAVEMSSFEIASSIVAGNRNGQAGVWIGPDSPSSILNCTIADNPGQGVRTESALLLANSILVAEPVGLTVAAGVTVATTNDFFSNTADSTGITLDGSNLFVDPELDDELHLAPSSPLVDIGAPGPFAVEGGSRPIPLSDVDVDGEARVMAGASDNPRVDLGADEVTGPTR